MVVKGVATMRKTFTLTVDSDGTCTILKGADEHKELFNHYGNACSYLQKEAEKFVAEMRMERNVKVKQELDLDLDALHPSTRELIEGD